MWAVLITKSRWPCALPIILHSKASFKGTAAASAKKGHISQNGPAAICQWENVSKKASNSGEGVEMLIGKTTPLIRRHVFTSLCHFIAKVHGLNRK